MRPLAPWPPDAAARYRARGCWSGRTLGDAFWASIDAHAARIAVVDGARRVTYAELGALVAGAAGVLARADLQGKPAVLQMPNSLELVVAYFACLTSGVVPVAAQPAHRAQEIRRLALAAQAAAWFVPASVRKHDFAQTIDDVLGVVPSIAHAFVLGGTASGRRRPFEELMAPSRERPRSSAEPGDVAVIQLSGGSTGGSKLIPRTHDDYLYVSLASNRAMRVDADTVFLGALPLAHNFSLATPGIQGVLLAGGKVVVCPSPAPDVVLPAIEAERVTWIPAVPATLIGLLEHPDLARYDVRSVRALYVGGQRLHPQPARDARAVFGDALQQIYGMAEGLICCTRAGDPEDVVLGTQGRPISDEDEVRIVDEAGIPVAAGEIGEIETRGAYTIRGYLDTSGINARAFAPDGFYRTGDLGRLHASGNVCVEGRRKDVINRGGEKIAADELEAMILECPLVSNVAVVPFPDRVLGERICAFVTPAPGRTVALADLVVFLRDERSLSPASLPERLYLRDPLPLTAVGKVAKTQLREEAARLAEAEKETEA